MTAKEREQIIRVHGENFEELEIPAYIRARDTEVVDQQKWAELHGARQNEEGEWEV